jgi:hypothetical protein
LKRIVIIGTTLAVLVGAAVAFAAFNNYTGSTLKYSHGAGSASKPVPLSSETILKANAPSGDRAAPLVNLKFVTYGIKYNGGKFPTCTDTQIVADKSKYEKACPAKSQIGSGPVHAELGPSTNPSASVGTACNPFLKVFNGGPSTQVFFFTTAPDAPSQYTCAGLATGATAPYDGHISYQGKNAVVNIPLPPDISNKVANQPGLYGSLIAEDISYPKLTIKKGGKTVAYGESIGCKNGKRPWSITFTADDYNTGTPETQTVTGSAPC